MKVKTKNGKPVMDPHHNKMRIEIKDGRILIDANVSAANVVELFHQAIALRWAIAESVSED